MAPFKAVLDWLLGSDPALRWQVLRDLDSGPVHFAMEDGDGQPSRWNTLRALRVLKWYDRDAR